MTEQAAHSPDRAAATFGDTSLSYRELDSAAGRVAVRLEARGIGPGHRVGLMIPPGFDRCICLLGVLRAGAAYVPLDPAYPAARLTRMADDAVLSLIVAANDVAEPGAGRIPVVSPAELSAPGVEPLRSSRAGPESPAYVIYTSGSTGDPKGVVMPHRALANLIRWQIQEPGFEGPSRTLHSTPLSFDVHFQELFSTWATGGEVVLVDAAVRRDPARLLAVLRRAGVERIFLPFVALRQLAEVATTHGPLPAGLREVVTAGEQLRVDEPIRAFFRQLPDCRLHNHYGPSETHVVTAHTLDGAPSTWPALPPIGRPIANTTIHLVDEDGRPVPPGEGGELCVSGVAVADGYWQRPELTAARFVEAPDGATMYRTGDLARMDEADDHHFLGRLDDQLKIRGHRVEPGEVEAEILAHPAVESCAVAGRDDGHGGRRLSAYLVLDTSRDGVRDRAAGLREERVAQWRGVWEGTYDSTVHNPTEPEEDSLDLRGWIDSYEGRPIPRDEMRAWADGSARQVLDLDPRRVLEIGAGTGLILFRVAPRCHTYHATDFSPEAVDVLRRRTAEAPPCEELRLEVAAAHELDRLDEGAFDVVVMNSVTQHFPDVEYLLRALTVAARRVRTGQIFIGDVTSERLHEAFFVTVEAGRADATDSRKVLSDRVALRLGDEEELVVDPDLFRRLGEWVPDVRSVEVRLKPGRYRNELSRFRYDVVVHLGEEPAEPVPVHVVDWAPEFDGQAELLALLDAHPDRALRIRGIRNARVVDAVAAAAALRAGEGDTVSEWRAAATARARGNSSRAREPQDFMDLADVTERPVQVTWGAGLDEFDVIVRPTGAEGRPLADDPELRPGPPSALVSMPLNVALMPHVAAELRQSLQSAVPEPMVPDRFVLLARLPTTPSGKLDRRALPDPGRRRPVMPNEYVAPTGETERALAAIWADLLGVEPVGATDSFFDLGGNSILAVRLAARVNAELVRDLPIVTFFEYPNIRALARLLDREGSDTDTEMDRLDDRADNRRRALSRRRRRRGRQDDSLE